MLIWQTDFIVVDVDHHLWEQLPEKEGKNLFPFYIDFTVQINGKIKRTRTSFDVTYYEDNTIPTWEKLDMKTLQTVINTYKELGYDLNYWELVNQIEDFTNYKMSEIRKYVPLWKNKECQKTSG